MIEDIRVRVNPQTAAEAELLRQAVAAEAGIRPADIHEMRIVRRSIDARQRNVMVNLTVRVAFREDRRLPEAFEPVHYPDVRGGKPVIIVGAGPAGLFAALEAIKCGMRPIVLERGADVDRRRKDLAAISREGVVSDRSNYCFGEGGAGAYSDGKLYTRSKKRGPVDEVLRTFVQHGADPDILVDAHPHIGSDKLPGVIKAMRRTIEESGGEVLFDTLVTGFATDSGSCGISGVVTERGTVYAGPVILATGHSARDVYKFLHKSGVRLEAKGIAIGVRLEHPQQLIDRIQYHSKDGRGKYLPAAEYSFVEQVDGRGVYSFCMCPGGVIVPAASGAEQSVVNGMSASARSSRWANSGMVVELHPGDIEGFADHGPLEMLALQEKLEADFFAAAGRTLKAPAQRMTDFVSRKISTTLPPSSYLPGLLSLPLHFLLPPFIESRLREGFRRMGRKSRGFLTADATMIGLESRTSSPVRIPRDPTTMAHPEVCGLYPVGEGAGYAGGIVSAALDGIRAARAVAHTISTQDNQPLNCIENEHNS